MINTYIFIRILSILITSFLFAFLIFKAFSFLRIPPILIISVIIIGTVIILALNLNPQNPPSGTDIDHPLKAF